MIEKLIVLEDIDPVIFYGVNNANIQLIKALYPKLRIVARGNVIKVLGDEEEMCAFEENITKLEKYCAEYNSLKEEVIIDIIIVNKSLFRLRHTQFQGRFPLQHSRCLLCSRHRRGIGVCVICRKYKPC